LADRCAFLLSRTAESRRRTRKAVKEIYQFRSKLVHGLTRNLNSQQRDLTQLAKYFLD